VSLHANRMPWIVAGTFPSDKDTWEFYHVDEDFSESVNVADKNPKKLAELTKRWDEFAEAGNVYPLLLPRAWRARAFRANKSK